MTAIPESDPFSIEADSDEEANIQAGAASTSGDIPLRSYPPTASSSAERRAEQAAYENADLGGLDEEGHALLDDVDGGDAEREGRPGRGIRSEAASVLRARERRERTRRARGYFGPIGGGWNSKLAKHRYFRPARTIFFSLLGLGSFLLLFFSLQAVFHTASSHAPGADSSSSAPPATHKLASSLDESARLSNGTHAWRRTIVVVSLDGVKSRWLDDGWLPHLQKLGTNQSAERGARRARSMTPVFPTLTFPNHWALLTGLHASSHGIVANDFYSPTLQKRFLYTDPAQSWDAAWWLGEPIWASAEAAGVPTAVVMWPGPPRTARGDRPAAFTPYEDGWPLTRKASKVLELLDREDKERPQLILAYVPDVDKAAHANGPDSGEVHSTLGGVDALVTSLSSGIHSRNLTNIVDLVFVSDHGMTSTSQERLVFLDEVLGEELFAKVEHQDGWPSAGLRFEDEEARKEAETKLRAHAAKPGAGFDVYTNASMLERWHYSGTDRIAPLWAIPHLGWSITTRKELKAMGDTYHPLGNHGFDNAEEDMHAIFVASGPSFKPLPSSSLISPPMDPAPGEGHLGPIPPTLYPSRASSPSGPSGPAGQNEAVMEASRWSLASRDQFATANYNMPNLRNLELYGLVAHVLGIPEKARAPTNGTKGFWDDHLRY